MEEWRIPLHEMCGSDDVELGKGSFGRVVLKDWRRTRVAYKLLEESTPATLELFRRELVVMTKMHHPNIVQILGYTEVPFGIVMEYIPGGDLSKKKNLTHVAKRRVCLDVMRGLSYMHNRTPHPCIHRDIKPRNILFTPSGTAKIADLGLSKLILPVVHGVSTADELAHSKEVGTERYAAPETRSNVYDAKVDVYSSGIVFYEMYESARFDGRNFEWAVTPARTRLAIAAMVSDSASDRPTALEAYDSIDAIPIDRCCVIG